MKELLDNENELLRRLFDLEAVLDFTDTYCVEVEIQSDGTYLSFVNGVAMCVAATPLFAIYSAMKGIEKELGIEFGKR